MRKIIFSVIFCAIVFLGYGQAPTHKNEGKGQLLKVLDRHTAYPRELVTKNVSGLFSLKIVFSSDTQIEQIISSKYTPEKMIPGLTNRSYYQGINWNDIFNRKVVKGDILIIPIIAYNKSATQSVFNEYLAEDLFEYQGVKQDFINCLVMQTYIINFREPYK